MTDTARLADVVIPATQFVEHDDIYQAGGHGYLQIGPKLIEPPGECRSNHEVLQGLATRLGARHRGFEMTAMEIVDWTLKASGWPDAASVQARGGIDAYPDFRAAHYLDGFGHADKRFHFAPDWAAIGPNHQRMPKLPDHMPAIDAESAERPFRLVTAPARQFLNTSFTETPTGVAREGRPHARVHPADAARLGLSAGSKVRLGNARGEVVLPTELFDGMQPGVIVVESVWPNSAFEGGIGINALTSDEPAFPNGGDEPAFPNGGAVFHDTAVWLRAERARMPEAAE
jgi:anaerobic selenocysteine-containing dehydrogenase